MAKNNNITLIVGGLRGGGSERNIRYLIEYFFDDYQITVYTLSDSHEDFYEFPSGVKIYHCGAPKAIQKIPFLGLFFSFLLILKFRIKHKPFISISFLTIPNAINIVASKLLRQQCLISERNDPRYSRYLKLYSKLIRYLYKKADKFVVQNTQIADYFEKFTGKRPSIIPNQIPDVDVSSLKIHKRKCISVIGSHKYQNRFDIFIDAVALIKMTKQFYDWEFEIVGANGQETPYLTKLVDKYDLKDKIVFKAPNNNILEYMINLEAVCITSEYEGMSNVALESASVGTSVIIGSHVNPGLINHGHTGIVLEVMNKSELSKALCYVMNKPNCFENDNLKIDRKYLKHFSKRTIKQKWRNIIA